MRHKLLCDIVEQHCIDKGWVTLRNYEYKEVDMDAPGGLVHGEVDILAANKYGWVFYEVKSQFTDKNWIKANEQFNRFYQTHKAAPQPIHGIYVAKGVVRRMRIDDI